MRNITESELRAAIDRAGLPPDTLPRIEAALRQEPQSASSFEAAHVAYYLGALLIIGAMGWFITSAWDTLAGATLTLVALVYAAVFGTAGVLLARRPGTLVPGGILMTVAVCMTPLAVYGVERQLGWWPAADPGGYVNFHPWINGSWVLMEACTVLAAFVAMRFVRFAFLSAPAAYALWYMSMDGTELILGKHWTFHQEAQISVVFGLVMILVAYLLDGERDVDLAFWFYLFGVLTFSGGLSCLGDGGQLGKFGYCMIHVAMIVLSIVLQRRVFLIFGAVGVFAYLGDEAYGYFSNSIGFAFGLTALGIVFIVAGLLYKRNEAAMTRVLEPLIPARIRHRHGLAVAPAAEAYS